MFRLTRTLQTDSGRKRILQTIEQRLPLSGRPSDPTTVGIEECKAVLDAMKAMKAGQVPGTQETEAGSQDTAGTQETAPAAACPPGTDTAETEDLFLADTIDDVEATEDPVLSKARGLAQQDLARISIFRDASQFVADMNSRLLPQHKVLFMLEAPTSKPRILHTLLATVKQCLPSQWAMWVPIGGRFDLLSAMESALTKAFPKRDVYTVTLGRQKQTAKAKNHHALFIPFESSKEVPERIDIGGCSGKSSECLRLRCNVAACPHFQALKASEDDESTLDENMDLDADDLENPIMEDFQEEDDHQEERDATESTRQDAAACPPEKKRLVNVFTFAQPVALYETVLGTLLGLGRATHLTVMTRSAHPSPLIAGRANLLEVIALFSGTSDHSFKHGEEILEKKMIMKSMAKAKSEVSVGIKRVASHELAFIMVDGSEVTQPVAMKSVVPAATSGWRAGFNLNPSDLETKILDLLQKDCSL